MHKDAPTRNDKEGKDTSASCTTPVSSQNNRVLSQYFVFYTSHLINRLSYHIISQHITSYHITSYYCTSGNTISYQFTSHYIGVGRGGAGGVYSIGEMYSIS